VALDGDWTDDGRPRIVERPRGPMSPLLTLAVTLALAAPDDDAPPPKATEGTDEVVDETPVEPVEDMTQGWSHTVLPNGMELTVLADPLLPVTATQTWVHVGGSHEAPDERGFAHLFEHMMFAATPTRDRGEYARFHTRIGGRRNAYTSYDETVYVSAVPPVHHAHVLEMEAERFSELIIGEEEMAKDRKIVTEELRLRSENSAEDRLVTALIRTLLAGHPYEHTPVGTKDDIAARTVDDARRFYEAYYRPDHLHMVVVGPVDRAAVEASVVEQFGGMEPSGVMPPDVPALTDIELPDRVKVKDKIPPVLAVGLAYPLPPRDHPDALIVSVMTQMLSGSELDVFRERHLDERSGIEAVTFHQQLKAGGILGFGSVHLPTASGRRRLQALRKTVNTLGDRSWNTQEALNAVRRRVLMSEHFSVYYAESQARRIGQARWHLGDVEQAFDRTDRLAEVTTDDIARVWQTWVAEADPSEAIVRRGKAQEVE